MGGIYSTGLGICSFAQNRLLFKSDPERCTRTICSLCSLQKSDLSNLLRSLITKEWLWAICSYPSLKKSKSAIHSKKGERIALSFFSSPKNERFARKTNERIPNPGHIWPTKGRCPYNNLKETCNTNLVYLQDCFSPEC